MRIIDIFKTIVEEINTYYEREVLGNYKISNKDIKINFNYKKYGNIKTHVDFNNFIEEIIAEIIDLRYLNQAQLQSEKFEVKSWAKNEIILLAINTAYESLADSFKNLIYLSNNDDNFLSLSINEKFALRKVCALALNLISKYEQLPNRLKKNDDLSSIIELVKEIITKDSFSEVEKLSKEIFIIHQRVLQSKDVICESDFDEEYGWIHDIVRISKVNAEVVSLLVKVEIYTNILKDNYYN